MTNKDFFKRVGCLLLACILFFVGLPVLFGLLLAFLSE